MLITLSLTVSTLWSVFLYLALSSSLQAVSAIADIRKDIPIHLELASMTDKDYMSRIMQEVHVEYS